MITVLIIVLDETAVYWDPKAVRVLAAHGEKNVITHSADEKMCTTALLSASVNVSYDDAGRPIFSNERHLPAHLIYDGLELTPKRRKKSKAALDAEEFSPVL